MVSETVPKIPGRERDSLTIDRLSVEFRFPVGVFPKFCGRCTLLVFLGNRNGQSSQCWEP